MRPLTPVISADGVSAGKCTQPENAHSLSPASLLPCRYPGFTLLMEVLKQQPSYHNWSTADQVQLTQVRGWVNQT